MMKAALIFVIAIALAVAFPVENGDSCCGTAGFDSSRQTCCGTKIHTTRDGFTCCGNEYYDPSAPGKLCCSTPEGDFLGTVSANAASPQCCGRRAFDAITQLCCSEETSSVVSLPSNDGSFSCCGTTRVFDSNTQLCCGDRVLTIPSNTQGNFECCGTTLVNLENQLCCNGVTRTLDSNSATVQDCCGTQLFDTTTQRCCEGATSSAVHRIEGNENLECCGATLFDSTTHTCCENTRPIEGFGSCCGQNSLYSEEFQECCLGRIGCGDACCGNMAYWSDEFTCCESNGKFQLHRGVGQTCCGTEVFDQTTHLCCGTTIYKAESCATECCGDLVYNPAIATCCETTDPDTGAVTERELLSGLGSCCRTDVFDEDSDRLFVPVAPASRPDDSRPEPSRDSRPEESRDSRPEESRDSREESRDSREESRESREESRESREESRDSREESRDSREESRDSREESRDSREESRKSRTNSRKLGLNPEQQSRSRSRTDRIRVVREVEADSTKPKKFVLYNPASEVCCPRNGKTNLFKRSCGDTCCTENGYFQNFQGCNCQGQVTSDPSRLFNCCGSKEFFPDDAEDPEVCCANDTTKTPKIFDFDPQGVCCGNEYITSNQQNVVCCFV